MKKVLIFSLNYYPHFIGGAEVAIKEITDRISPEDIEFHLVCLRMDSDLPKEEQIGNVLVHRIGIGRQAPSIADLQKFPLKLTKYWYQFGAARAASQLHRKYHFDGIWAMMAHSCAVPAGIFKKKHPEVKYLLTLQEGDPPEYIEKLAKPVWPWFVRGFTSADALQPISNFLRTWGQRMGFVGESEVIPNAVNTKHFTQSLSEADRRVTREMLGVNEGAVLLVTTSRFVHKNACDDVIRALPLLPENVHFVIYGIGPDEAMLRELVKKEGLENRVHFMGQIGHAEMPTALKACDIFIRPSRSEGMGNSFVEAMAAELPVIATQEGGIADFLFDAKRNPDKKTTGWAVEKDSPEQIAKAVQDIIGHPEQVKAVLKTAKALAIAEYDWNLIADKMKSLFGRLLQKGKHIPMKLLVATPLYPPEPGGPATYAKLLFEGLPAKDIEVSLVKFGDVRNLPKVIRHIAYFWRVYRAAKKVDLVLALDPVSVGVPVQFAARFAKKPYIVKVVGDYAWEQGQQRFGVKETLDIFVTRRQSSSAVRFLQRLQTRVALRAARVIVPSEYLKDIVSKWGIVPEKIEVIHNAVPTEDVGTVPKAVKDFPHPLVVTAGRLVPWKRIGAIIEAVAATDKITLAVVGDGPDRAELEAKAEMRLVGRAVFTGALTHADTLAVLKTADVFVLNSSYEGFSHLLIEAQTLGVPIIAARVGGNAEIITNGESGLLVPSGDMSALIQAIVQIVSDENLSTKLRNNAKESAKRFFVETMLTKTATFLRAILK